MATNLIVKIPLINGGHAIIDAEDAERIMAFKWRRHDNRTGTSYAIKTRSKKWTEMSHVVLGIDSEIDHKNHNGLDNRKSNLRPCNRSQNTANARKRPGQYLRGVQKWSNKYGAGITINGKWVHLGTFLTEREAALAYDEAAREVFGEFATTNF